MANQKSTKRALLSSVLALFLCCAMLLGTTYAWFTDTATSSGNVIQTGKLKVGFQWADGKEDPTAVTWADVEGALFDYDNWEPGYAVAKHLKVSNEGTLALNYRMRIVADGVVSKLADAIDVYVVAGADVKALARVDLKTLNPIGTLTEVLGTAKNLSKAINGSIKANEEADIYTLVLKMNENAGNEYQAMDLGCTFSVELLATQMSDENDSFGNTYDDPTTVPNESIPAALVRALDDLDITATAGMGGTSKPLVLDAGYQFEPTVSYADAQDSLYRYWHADFVVKADKDVPAESMALAGYYSAFCDDFNNGNWVSLTSSETITAGTEIRLVAGMASGATVNWEEICNYGNDGKGFQCGLVDVTGENAGTTVTVELRIYETTADYADDNPPSRNEETENYLTVGVFEYQFPATSVAGQNELNDAIAGDDDVVIDLGAGNYTLPATNGKTVEIIGTEDTVIDVTSGYYADRANLTFKGVTFNCTMDNANGGDYELLYSPNVTFIDCTFNGAHGVGRDGASYIGCTFNLPFDYVWNFANDTVFDGCTFNSQGKALLLYNHGGSEMVNVTVKNCVFNATAGAKAGAIANQNCAAIEIDNYGCSFNLVTENNTVDSDFSGEWRIKSFYGNGNTVTVNGTSYSTIALDGRTMTIDANKNVTVQ